MPRVVDKMEEIEIYIPIDPRQLPTAQQKGERVIMGKGGKPFIHHFEKSKVSRGRRLLENAILDAIGDKPIVKAEKGTAVYVAVSFVYPLGSQPKRMAGKYKTTRPDGDNLVKGLFDSCTRLGFWDDDAQLQIGGVFRRYAHEGEEPHINLEISHIE
jgi:Holliday junction resolvase RusA-like endonuclease